MPQLAPKNRSHRKGEKNVYKGMGIRISDLFGEHYKIRIRVQKRPHLPLRMRVAGGRISGALAVGPKTKKAAFHTESDLQSPCSTLRNAYSTATMDCMALKPPAVVKRTE